MKTKQNQHLPSQTTSPETKSSSQDLDGSDRYESSGNGSFVVFEFAEVNTFSGGAGKCFDSVEIDHSARLVRKVQMATDPARYRKRKGIGLINAIQKLWQKLLSRFSRRIKMR
jgi:hypothetical protein